MTNWEELESACETCKNCSLWETRSKLVFGVGKLSAEVLFIGEGPGENEDLEGEPFVGRAGKLLDDMLRIINLDREKNTYIANIVKCRPPKNRDPLPEEREACKPWLSAQISLIMPKIVVCLGRIAAIEMIDQSFKVTQDHGKWYDIDGVKYMGLFHPAALLRDPNRRPETFLDLKELERVIKEICNDTYGGDK
ncbi:MAG: uracil-DNA glycosylase [Oscillospiraceae bacterium]|nr:uracil-DNA glycosylase [Oscillospiraceae bacterium]